MHVSVHQFDAQYGIALLHLVEHQVEVRLNEEVLGQTGCRHFQSLEAAKQQRHCLMVIACLSPVGHAEHKETVRILTLHHVQIVILQTVDKLLCDNCCRNLSIVHVGQETLCRVQPVRHVRRQHLALLAEEQRTAAVRLELVNGLSIHHRILVKPQMGVRIDYVLAHDTRC